MKKKIVRCPRAGVVLAILAAAFVTVLAFDALAAKEGARGRKVIIHLQNIFDANVTLTPFEGKKAINPIAEVKGVKNREKAVLGVPGEYLPGEFVLRIDYRAKESDHPYPSERIIFVNNEDVELLDVDPPYINNNEKTRLNKGEKENTVYSVFMKENGAKRAQIDLLRQFLLSYDRPKSAFYAEAVKEFEQRRLEYNAWLAEQAKKYHKLYVSRLFQFQYVPAVEWSGSEEERLNRILKNYFDGVDLSDPLVVRSREMAQLMDTYMGYYGMRAKTEEERGTLFTEAGRVACEKASKGSPEVYGWMVDYFYNGYETYNIKKGMAMLEEHVNNPNCLTSKKQQIIKRLKGMEELKPGVLSPDFTISDDKGRVFEFHKWKGNTPYKLLLFWSGDCESCRQLVNGLAQWYNTAGNKDKLDIIAINLAEAPDAEQKWQTVVATVPAWAHFYVQEGINSPVARDYAILSTPVMFLIDGKSNVIVEVPEDLDALIKDLQVSVVSLLCPQEIPAKSMRE